MSRNWTDEGSLGWLCIGQKEQRECRNLPTSQSKEVIGKWESLLRQDHRIKVGGDGADKSRQGPSHRLLYSLSAYQGTPKFNNSKQQPFIVSLFRWVRNLDAAQLAASDSGCLTKL